MTALATLIARRGYGETSPPDVAAAAGVTLGRVLEIFPTREACLVATLTQAGAQVLQSVIGAAARECPWPIAARLRVRALLRHYVQHPGLARLVFLESLRGGPAAIGVVDQLVTNLGAALVAGAPAPADELALVGEAIAGAFEDVLYRSAVESKTATLLSLEAQMAWVAAAPFLGARSATGPRSLTA